MSEPVRMGVIGAGLVAQWLHIPNLLGLADSFALVGVCDPSAEVRGFVARHFGVPTFADSDALLAEGLDAVLIASPDFTHVEETLKALAHDLHVFCEKPLCYAPAHAAAIIKAREKAGRIVQVGYMKRHDRAYETCLELLPASADELRYVSIEVIDPDFAPYIDAHQPVASGDMPADLVAAGRKARAAQIAEALGFEPSAALAKGFAERYCSSLIHDVNALMGLLDHMNEGAGEIAGATLFADGGGGSATLRLAGGRALCQMSHIALSGVPDYRERIALYFDRQTFELQFASPYLVNVPTSLRVFGPDRDGFEKRDIFSGHDNAFTRELKAFRASIRTGKPVRNSVELAQRDLALLCDLARHADGRLPLYRASYTDPRSDWQTGVIPRHDAIA